MTAVILLADDLETPKETSISNIKLSTKLNLNFKQLSLLIYNLKSSESWTRLSSIWFAKQTRNIIVIRRSDQRFRLILFGRKQLSSSVHCNITGINKISEAYKSLILFQRLLSFFTFSKTYHVPGIEVQIDSITSRVTLQQPCNLFDIYNLVAKNSNFHIKFVPEKFSGVIIRHCKYGVCIIQQCSLMLTGQKTMEQLINMQKIVQQLISTAVATTKN